MKDNKVIERGLTNDLSLTIRLSALGDAIRVAKTIKMIWPATPNTAVHLTQIASDAKTEPRKMYRGFAPADFDICS